MIAGNVYINFNEGLRGIEKCIAAGTWEARLRRVADDRVVLKLLTAK